jgi:hypothetical protein
MLMVTRTHIAPWLELAGPRCNREPAELAHEIHIQDAKPPKARGTRPLATVAAHTTTEGAAPPLLPGGVGGSYQGRRKIGSGPAGLKVDPHKGLRSPLTMDSDGCVREG